MSENSHSHIVRILFGILVCAAACLHIAHAENARNAKPLEEVEQVMLFAIKREAITGAFRQRKDVCVGFGSTLAHSEKRIISELRREGLQFHENDWCNRGPRGLKISIIAPVVEATPGIYEVTVELGDLNPIRERGEHFATLLRKGKYTIRQPNSSKLELVSYQQDCCASQH
jgi:hypothetical protein